VVCHAGVSLSSGHYISYVRAPPSNGRASKITDATLDGSDAADAEPAWLICNDDMVTAVPETELKRKLSADVATTPYILFYRRMSA